VTRLIKALIRLQTDLRSLDLPWALVGGLALSARATPRTTNDIDVAIAVMSDREAERIVLSLKLRGYKEQPRGVLDQKDVGRLATVRLLLAQPEAAGVEVDLLFASSGVEPEIVAMAQTLEVLPGVYVPVIRTGQLLALKVLAGRDKDRADVRSLIESALSEDLQLARETLTLIERRGYHRGKNLLVELARLEDPE
jgi:Nucleotidyl transferase AbiEii toxin, Type IV TA system